MPRMFVCLVLAALAGFALTAGLTPAVAQNSDRATGERSVQRRPQIVIHPRHRLSPNATRHCVAWLAKENWPNGQVVITPQKRCWWED
jgi:hypothetical protein